MSAAAPGRDAPWIFRTYAGHSSARASNALFRQNLAAGQTGLSIAFDLPTQCGYDADHPMAAAEVGKVGVPIGSLDDMHVLFDGLPLAEMNTSMTINGTAPWLLALYLALAEERGVEVAGLRGTTQNDIIKEFLARGTYVFPPGPSMRLVAETYEYCAAHVPRWNPSNVCSYHLQEAGATPVQELAFTLASAMGVLDLVRARGRVDAAGLAGCVGRMSFFVNAGIRFVEEMCKVRAFGQLWEEVTRERYGVDDPRREFRYGVQVNSLRLTGWRSRRTTPGASCSRRSAWTLWSKAARCRALQLPTWNEALSSAAAVGSAVVCCACSRSSPTRPTCSKVPDLFDGNPAIAAKTARSSTAPAPSWPPSPRWAASRPRSSAATLARAGALDMPAGSPASRPASRSW
ncbi:MAG: methylmalonyl-CoA mutase family protein [Kofleriaceae bacterium]